MSNHTAFDGTREALPKLAARKPGDPHPLIVGKESGQRYMTIVGECAKAYGKVLVRLAMQRSSQRKRLPKIRFSLRKLRASSFDLAKLLQTSRELSGRFLPPPDRDGAPNESLGVIGQGEVLVDPPDLP